MAFRLLGFVAGFADPFSDQCELENTAEPLKLLGGRKWAVIPGRTEVIEGGKVQIKYISNALIACKIL